MKMKFIMFALLALLTASPATAQDKILTISTTTSTQSSGLLDLLLPEFKKDSGITVKVIAKGTGAAIRDGMDGNVDLIFVHAKARELEFVAKGFGTKRYAVMHNDFLIAGPQADPAAIAGQTEAAKALAKIAASQATFISRGDDSGTHTKEQYLWQASGVKLIKESQSIIKKGKEKKISFQRPANSNAWYMSIGQGMGKATTFADEKQAYLLIDRGTFIKYKYGKTPALDLVALCQGGKDLANPYGVIPVSPAKHPHVKFDLAVQFADWITGQKGQQLINGYRLVGKQLFYGDAS